MTQHWEIGCMLAGKYRLRRRLGVGGAGEVWKAENVLVDRTVAIKLLHRHLAVDPRSHARFITEAKAAARIAHVNVVDVFDVGTSRDGTPFIVMELCDGETLGMMLATRGAVGVSYAADFLLQVLAGLRAAHELGVVHRDLKPENIVVVHPRPERPVVKVLDFGIAQCAPGEHSTADDPGAVFGTPAYMPPEQALGEPVDARADIYAAGVILYELLTGSPPFSGDTHQVLSQVLLEVPSPPSHWVAGIPGDLDALVLSAMAKDPRNRPQTARAFLGALLPFASLQPDLSWRPSVRESDPPVPLVEARIRKGGRGSRHPMACQSSWPLRLSRTKLH